MDERRCRHDMMMNNKIQDIHPSWHHTFPTFIKDRVKVNCYIIAHNPIRGIGKSALHLTQQY